MICDKKEALNERPDSFEIRLFFQARNLAIESLLLRLENKLLREGFPVSCDWKESSFCSPTIEIKFHNEKKSGAWKFAKSTIWINRDSVSVFDRNNVSDCFYTVKECCENEYWRGRQPQLLLKFRNRIRELFDLGYFADEVEKVNYPFNRQSFSSF